MSASVRQVIDANTAVTHYYTYDPWGDALEEANDIFYNPYRFAGYYRDIAADSYYCFNRWYYPGVGRFTARDPVPGKFIDPMSLHAYLYCQNDSINYIDPSGEIGFLIGGSLSFSGGEAANFATNAMRTTRNLFGGILGRAISVAVGLMARNSYTMQAANILGNYTGGSIGAGTAFGYGNGKLFGGSVYWAAVGATKGMSLSATADYAISNANCLQDFAGTFVEAGGSKSLSGPLGPFLTGTIGGSISKSLNSDIWLATVTFGGTVGSPGYEGHVFVGEAWVAEW